MKYEEDKYSKRISKLQEKFKTCTELILNQNSMTMKSVDDSQEMKFENDSPKAARPIDD